MGILMAGGESLTATVETMIEEFVNGELLAQIKTEADLARYMNMLVDQLCMAFSNNKVKVSVEHDRITEAFAEYTCALRSREP